MVDDVLETKCLIGDENGKPTPLLHFAVRNSNKAKHDNIKEIRRLLKTDIDVNELDRYGRTALEIAISKNNIRIVKLLIKHDAALVDYKGLLCSLKIAKLLDKNNIAKPVKAAEKRTLNNKIVKTITELNGWTSYTVNTF